MTFEPKVFKDGELQDTYDRDRRANREKAYQKLDTEMIGLVRRKRKKSSLVTRRKFSGRLTKNANVNVVQPIVLRDVLNVKLRSKASKLGF